jgi:hypothetical protein
LPKGAFVDVMRDLCGAEPWRESLERSLARRGNRRHSSIEPDRLRPPREPDRDQALVHESASYFLLCWQAISKGSMMLLTSAAGLFTLAMLATTQPSVSAGRVVQASATAAHANVSRAAASSSSGGSGRAALGSAGAGVNGAETCQPVSSSDGYIDPLAGAIVTPERIDQGVDYAGSGTLTAIGPARVTYLATFNTGWPGAFIEYQLLGGPDNGCHVYYAEGVTPAEGLYIGETVRAGQALAAIIHGSSSGIEIGWGAGYGTKSHAAQIGEWSATRDADSIPTAAGESFSALIASLGGPPGKTEG